MKYIFLVLVLGLSSLSFAADMPTGQADWMKFTTPAAEHKGLSEFAGKWKYTMKWWMDATSKPEESKGTSNNKVIMGGRFLQQEAKAKMGKMTFDGLGFTGFDTLRGEYQTVWLDNMSTHIMTGAGTMDTATNTLTTKGDFSCAMSQDKHRTYRTEMHKISKNEHTFAMYMNGTDGKEFKAMEITYTR